jgi:hypothetical protein
LNTKLVWCLIPLALYHVMYQPRNYILCQTLVITCQNQRTEKYSILTYFMKTSFKSDLVIVLEYRSFLKIQPKPKLHGPNLTIDLWDLYGPHVIIGLAIHIWLSGWFFSQSLWVRKELSSVYSFLIMQLRQMSSIILQIARFFGRKRCGKMTF